MEPSLKLVPCMPSLHIPAKPHSLRYHWHQQPSADLQCSPLPRLLPISESCQLSHSNTLLPPPTLINHCTVRICCCTVSSPADHDGSLLEVCALYAVPAQPRCAAHGGRLAPHQLAERTRGGAVAGLAEVVRSHLLVPDVTEEMT
jgi:hypothetical protein